LIDALSSRRLGYAALDVFEQEPTSPDRWRGVPNILLTPHIAGVSWQSTGRLREAAIRNLASLLDAYPLVHEFLSDAIERET
jgi:phosphoglycerate dehydrogenase-like enzyme